jgi:hypothetical protein
MIEKEYFTRSIYVDLMAATIGINKEDWYCFKPGMNRQEVIKTILDNKYDVVPILNKQGTFNSYFTLNKLDNSKLDVNNIENEDRLYYLTHIRDAVWRMKNSKKTHFFLSNGHDENDIVGLLSLSNFNSREFYVYLFSILSYIEREFASLIESDKTNGFILLEKRSKTEESKKQLIEIKDRYNKDVISENENDYKEYLYLHHLIWLIIEEEQYKKLYYKSSQDFESGTGILKNLRNSIAHPVKSLVRNLTDLAKLDIGMNKLFEFKERIDKLGLIETD